MRDKTFWPYLIRLHTIYQQCFSRYGYLFLIDDIEMIYYLLSTISVSDTSDIQCGKQINHLVNIYRVLFEAFHFFQCLLVLFLVSIKFRSASFD